MNACHKRIEASKQYVTSKTVSVDALTAFRPINPIEKANSAYTTMADTEFGVMSEAMQRVYALSDYADSFTGDRNLNKIASIRNFVPPRHDSTRIYRIFSAPSSQPELRRADTADTFDYYLSKADFSSTDVLLFVSSNICCNRQFLQIAHSLVNIDCPKGFDIVGCTADDDVTTREDFNPAQYVQEFIGTLNLIESFRALP